MLVSAPGQPGPPRVGLVVPRSVGSAVVRNRVKRRLRHAAADAALKPGVDYVIIANAKVEKSPFSDLQSWLDRALEETR